MQELKIVLKLRNVSIKSIYCLISGENVSSFSNGGAISLKRGGAKIDEYFDEKTHLLIKNAKIWCF